MKNIEDIMITFEAGIAKSLACCIGSALSFLASTEMPHGLAANAAGMTGWGLAIATIVVLAKTCKHLYERQDERDKEYYLKLKEKEDRIEELHAQLLKTATEEE